MKHEVYKAVSFASLFGILGVAFAWSLTASGQHYPIPTTGFSGGAGQDVAISDTSGNTMYVGWGVNGNFGIRTNEAGAAGDGGTFETTRIDIKSNAGANEPISINGASVAVRLGSTSKVSWMSNVDATAGTEDIRLSRSDAGIMRIQNPGATDGGVMEFIEMTEGDPAAGAGDSARLYAKDNGAGKTQLCAVFSSGAAQCFATQP